jgi:hypothetical protein
MASEIGHARAIAVSISAIIIRVTAVVWATPVIDRSAAIIIIVIIGAAVLGGSNR